MLVHGEFNALLLPTVVALCGATFDLVIWPSWFWPLLGHPAAKSTLHVSVSTSELSLHPGGGLCTFLVENPDKHICLFPSGVGSLCGFLFIIAVFAYVSKKKKICSSKSLSQLFHSLVPTILAPSTEEEKNCISVWIFQRLDTVGTLDIWKHIHWFNCNLLHFNQINASKA